MTQNANPLTPKASLLCKLGSLVVHAQEGRSPKWHDFDWQAFDSLSNDPEVREWLAQMDAMCMLPVKR
jgi:hypothetical protein